MPSLSIESPMRWLAVLITVSSALILTGLAERAIADNWIDTNTGQRVADRPVITGADGKTYYVQADAADRDRAHDEKTGRNFFRDPRDCYWYDAKTGQRVTGRPVITGPDGKTYYVQADAADRDRAHDEKTGRNFAVVPCRTTETATAPPPAVPKVGTEPTPEGMRRASTTPPTTITPPETVTRPPTSTTPPTTITPPETVTRPPTSTTPPTTITPPETATRSPTSTTPLTTITRLETVTRPPTSTTLPTTITRLETVTRPPTSTTLPTTITPPETATRSPTSTTLPTTITPPETATWSPTSTTPPTTITPPETVTRPPTSTTPPTTITPLETVTRPPTSSTTPPTTITPLETVTRPPTSTTPPTPRTPVILPEQTTTRPPVVPPVDTGRGEEDRGRRLIQPPNQPVVPVSPPPPDNGKTTDELIQRLGREIKEQPPATQERGFTPNAFAQGRQVIPPPPPATGAEQSAEGETAFNPKTGDNFHWDPDKQSWINSKTGENVGIRGRYVTTLDGKLVIPPPPPATGAEQSAEGETAFNPKTGDNFHWDRDKQSWINSKTGEDVGIRGRYVTTSEGTSKP